MPRIAHVLAYDIHDDKRRRNIAKLMEGCAVRVQKSVFETFLSEKQVLALVNAHLQCIAPSEGDSLRVYRVCAECMRHFYTVGGVEVDWDAAVVL